MEKLELVTAIVGKIQDTSYTTTAILAALNRGVLEIAGGGDRQYGLPLLAPLPDLLSSGTVATDTTSNASMPATFHRGLFRVTDSSGNKIKMRDSFLGFFDSYPGLVTVGSVEEVCLKGNTLYYQGIPAVSVDLTTWFFRLPVDMVGDTDEPDGIPSHLQYRLLYNFACMEIFDEIEDGIEGDKTNTNHHRREFQKALTDLDRFIGPEDQDPDYVEDLSDYIE